MIYRTVIVAMLIVVGACTSAGAGVTLNDKVGKDLEFWYNYYFYPAYITRRIDSLNAIRTNSQPVGLEVLIPRNRLMNSRIHFRFPKGEPHIGAFLRYHGDGSDLETIGVNVSSHFFDRAVVFFPLEVVPDLVELETVERINYSGPTADHGPYDRFVLGLAGESPVKKKPPEPGNLQVHVSNAADDSAIRLWLLRFPEMTHVELRNRVQRAVNHDNVILTIDELPVANYHLMVIPTDSGLCAQSLINVAVCADSCTSVDVSFARRELPNGTATKFGVWRRDEGNVKPCDK